MTDRTDAELNAAVAQAMGLESPPEGKPGGRYRWLQRVGGTLRSECPPDLLSPAGFFEILAECERRDLGMFIEPDTLCIQAPDSEEVLSYTTYADLEALPRALAEAFLEACEAGA